MFARINVSVTPEAKDVLFKYQRKRGIKDQGNALDSLLMEFQDIMGRKKDGVKI